MERPLGIEMRNEGQKEEANTYCKCLPPVFLGMLGIKTDVLPDIYAILGSDIEFVTFLDVECLVPLFALGNTAVDTEEVG